MDNAYNNNMAINNLVIKLGFNSKERYIWYIAYIFNLVA